jgi:hypothetical protein
MTIWATHAQADVDIQAGVGYAVTGSIRTTETAKVSGTPMSFAAGYEGNLFKIGRYNVAGIMQHQVIGYDEKEGSQFRGSNLLMGGALGWQLLTFGKSFVRVEGAYYPYAVLSMTSETTSTVNGQEYGHSTLTTLTGTGATEVRVSYMSETKEGQFNKYERLRYGVFVTQLTQAMKKEKIKIVTSNPDLAPRGEVENDVSYALSMTSAGFLVGFAF